MAKVLTFLKEVEREIVRVIGSEALFSSRVLRHPTNWRELRLGRISTIPKVGVEQLIAFNYVGRFHCYPADSCWMGQGLGLFSMGGH